jgi:hypothetical protein
MSFVPAATTDRVENFDLPLLGTATTCTPSLAGNPTYWICQESSAKEIMHPDPLGLLRKEETEEHHMGSDKNFSHSGDPTALLPFISLYGSAAIIWMDGRMDDQMDKWRPQFNQKHKKTQTNFYIRLSVRDLMQVDNE